MKPWTFEYFVSWFLAAIASLMLVSTDLISNRYYKPDLVGPVVIAGNAKRNLPVVAGFWLIFSVALQYFFHRGIVAIFGLDPETIKIIRQSSAYQAYHGTEEYYSSRGYLKDGCLVGTVPKTAAKELANARKTRDEEIGKELGEWAVESLRLDPGSIRGNNRYFN